MIRLLALMPKANDGVTWYRLCQFFRKAQEKGKIDGQFLNPQLSDEIFAQIISSSNAYIGLAASSSIIKIFNILKSSKPKNKPLIVDIDDNYELVNPLSDFYYIYGTKDVILPDGRVLWKDGVGGFNIKRNLENIEKIKEILKMADLITTTTFKMKQWLEKLNQKVVVIPNCIDKKFFPYLDLKKDNIVRVGWMGGSSHFADIMSILPSLSKILKKYPHVHYYHIGQWFGVVEKYIPKSRLHKYQWINADGHGYRQATLNLDIGLCPLTDDGFNEYKSCIKFYEYSATKTATLAKNMLPYSEEIIEDDNGLLYNDTKDFEEKLEFLITHPLERKLMAEEAYKYVYKYRNLDTIADDWIFVIQELLTYFHG